MKVKIGDKIYDSTKEPIMVILSNEDKQNISNMDPEQFKYCSFPESSGIQDVVNFMKGDYGDDGKDGK
jgi:hypothetical protein